MARFLEALGNIIDQQIAPGENTARSLDSPVDPSDPDKSTNFGSLGSFANRIDQTAQRSYVETGYIRNVRPRSLDILQQEPDMTLVVKKRMFSSLADNYNFELMDFSEKLFIRASKVLFKNKCQVISVYEKLTRVEKVIKNTGVIDEYLLPIISTGIEALDNFGVNIVDAKTRVAINTMQKLYKYSEPSEFTTWISDNLGSLFTSEAGDGTGVFEITLASSVNTTNSVMWGQGRANFSFEDPYKLMVIIEDDIDKALADAGNLTQQGIFDVTQKELEELTNKLKAQLDQDRVTRGASLIKFMVNDDTLLYKRVRAIVDLEGKEIFINYEPGSPSTVLFDPAALIGAFPSTLNAIKGDVDIDQESVSDFNKLNSGELTLFKQIIENTFQLLNFKRNQQAVIDDDNLSPEVKFVREKMRLHFANKTIIQPMDSIHVFVSTKTRLDDKVLGITSSTLSPSKLLSTLNSSIDTIEQSFDEIRSFFGNTVPSIDVEKNAIVGADFPSWLWTLLRNDFTRQSAGIQIFGGLVNSASHTYSDGKYTANIGALDNSYYYRLGQINLKPSVYVYNTALYDPLTPYKLEFDASTGFLEGGLPPLLDENEKLLTGMGAVQKNGPFKGRTTTKTIYSARDMEALNGANSGLTFRQVFFDPDGFVYRWKTGIGSLTLFGEPHPNVAYGKETAAPSMSTNPFAGQDVMNVLSLLITAQPYNYNTFISAAIKAGNLTRDDLTNQAANSSYFKGLTSGLSRNNLVWGNFIPFKSLIISQQGYSTLLSAQFDISEAHNQINQLISERARLYDALLQTSYGSKFSGTPQFYQTDKNGNVSPPPANLFSDSGSRDAKIVNDTAIQIIEKDAQLRQITQKLYNKIAHPNIGDNSIKIFGDDLSFSPEASQGSAMTQDEIDKQRKELMDRINNYTLRRLWKVKANEDENFFIVDDQYDKNYDIQAFERSLSDLKLLNSDYSNVFEHIDNVRKLLGLEVFADTQGHIRARPPAYNKIPSSVFYDMIASGKRLFPKILEDLFLNQVEGLTQQAEIVEDEIRLRLAALGISDDGSMERFLNGEISNNGYLFKFVTSFATGRIDGLKDIRNITQQVTPDQNQPLSGALKPVNTIINNQLSQAGLFDVRAQISALDTPTFYAQQNLSASTQSAILIIKERLEQKKGMRVEIPNQPVSNGLISQTGLLSIVNEISSFVSERQNILKMLSAAMKNMEQGISANQDPSTARQNLFPNLFGEDSIPEFLSHMIENENYDDLGEGSGKRYVIKDNQIISLTIEEKPPDFTAVEATGLFGEGFVRPPSDLSIGSGGNAVTTAFATDYDMWNMYGFKSMQPTEFPFLSNPDTQLAPMAVWMLNNERKKIFQANLVIVGNEYMQPGEVIFIEDRNMLFYIDSVSHNFSFGGQFTTTLSLSYGRNPGEYIPTQLDLVGKALYSKRNQANLVRTVREGNSDGSKHLGILVVNNTAPTTLNNLFSGSYGDKNRKSLISMLFAVSNTITPGLDEKLVVEFRVYYNSMRGAPSASSSLVNASQLAISWLNSPNNNTNASDEVISGIPEGVGLASNENISLVVERVDLAQYTKPTTDTTSESFVIRSPSSLAYGTARSLYKGNNIFAQVMDPALPEASVIYNNIIDVWARYESKEASDSTTTFLDTTDGGQSAIATASRLAREYYKTPGS